MHGGFRGRRSRVLLLTVLAVALGAIFAAPARATEGGASVCPLGSGAAMPAGAGA